MSVRYFLDTNILIYTFDRRDARKRDVARELVRNALEKGRGCISSQVVQEFLNVATRKFERPLSAVDARRYLTDVLAPLCDVFASIGLYREGLAVAERWGFGFYDALIVAAALAANCDRVYSEDLQHGQRIRGLTVVNPFQDEP